MTALYQLSYTRMCFTVNLSKSIGTPSQATKINYTHPKMRCQPRKRWDSNPRDAVRRLLAFQASPFVHSGTLPSAEFFQELHQAFTSVKFSATRNRFVECQQEYQNQTGPSAAGPLGVEPRPRGLEALVLPLHYRPIFR